MKNYFAGKVIGAFEFSLLNFKLLLELFSLGVDCYKF